MTYADMYADLRNDAESSPWLLDALFALNRRLPDLALDDVDILYTLCLLRRAESLNQE